MRDKVIMHFLNEETIAQRGYVTIRPVQLASGRVGTQTQGNVSLRPALMGLLHCLCSELGSEPLRFRFRKSNLH